MPTTKEERIQRLRRLYAVAPEDAIREEANPWELHNKLNRLGGVIVLDEYAILEKPKDEYNIK